MKVKTDYTLQAIRFFIWNNIDYTYENHRLSFNCMSCDQMVLMRSDSSWCCHTCGIEGDLNMIQDLLADSGYAVHCLSNK